MTGVAIVTGAGSGIGRAVAQRLARDGMAVVVNDLTADRAEAVVKEIAAAGGSAAACEGDVASEADVATLVGFTLETFGECTLLVNNAGFVHQARFVDIAPADFDRMFAVHVRGTYLCTRAVLPAMLARGDGVIVNIASQLGQIGGIELTHYSAAKAAIIGLTKSLAREVSGSGVRVNAVRLARSIRRSCAAFPPNGRPPRRANCRLAASASLRKWRPRSPFSPRPRRACSSARRSDRIPAT